jgi:putative peptidoglycan lipid II flippase
VSEAPQPRKKPSLIRSSMIFASLTLISRIMGFVRDIIVTRAMGATATIAADAYYTAQTFPNLFRRIFAEGAFAAAFVPAYSKKLGAQGEAEADRMASDALATVAFASVILTVVCMLLMPWIMRLYSPGYVDDPAKFKLTWMLTIVTMPYLPCMVIASVFSGVLNARGRFIVSGAYPTILNLVILALVWPQSDPVSAAWAGSIGVIIAGVGQAAVCWWGAKKTGARIRLVRPKLTPEMKQLLKTAIPAAVANSATQINITVSSILASQVDGMRVWMSVADRLYQLPMSLVGVAIGIALLPRLAQAFQAKDEEDARAAMDQSLTFALALSLPAAAALTAIPVLLMDGLFTRGLFTYEDAEATGALLFHYGWGVPAFVLLRILQPAFFARGDTKTPMRYSLVSVAVNIVLGVALFYSVGFYGIAIATSLAAWINVVQMVLALWRRSVYRPSRKAIEKILRVTIASAALGAVLLLARHFYSALEAPFIGLRMPGFTTKEVTMVLIVLVGAAVYPLFLFAFGGVTPAEARAALRRKKADPPIADLQ